MRIFIILAIVALIIGLTAANKTKKPKYTRKPCPKDATRIVNRNTRVTRPVVNDLKAATPKYDDLPYYEKSSEYDIRSDHRDELKVNLTIHATIRHTMKLIKNIRAACKNSKKQNANSDCRETMMKIHEHTLNVIFAFGDLIEKINTEMGKRREAEKNLKRTKKPNARPPTHKPNNKTPRPQNNNNNNNNRRTTRHPNRRTRFPPRPRRRFINGRVYIYINGKWVPDNRPPPTHNPRSRVILLDGVRYIPGTNGYYPENPNTPTRRPLPNGKQETRTIDGQIYVYKSGSWVLDGHVDGNVPAKMFRGKLFYNKNGKYISSGLNIEEDKKNGVIKFDKTEHKKVEQ